MLLHTRTRSLFVLLLGSVIASGGCSALGPAPGISSEAPLTSGRSQDQFNAVAKAAENNAVVLDVVGAEQPTRIIPLPADGQPVYVSTLLQQSDLTRQFSRMQATLYRNSPGVIGGVRMGVRFHDDGNQIAPEHDYALRPGDRLQVVEDVRSPLQELGGVFGASNARRAMVGW